MKKKFFDDEIYGLSFSSHRRTRELLNLHTKLISEDRLREVGIYFSRIEKSAF